MGPVRGPDRPLEVSSVLSHDGWGARPLASLDLETTGVDPLADRVVSYALLDAAGTERCGLVRPDVPVPAASSQVHGITAAMLVDAPAPAEALSPVLAWVQDLVETGTGLVVFNASYDLTLLRSEAARHGLRQPDWERLLVVDPFLLDWGVDRADRKRRLVDLAEHYGVLLELAHDATADARAAREVAVRLATRHPDVARIPLADLMGSQRRWHAERVAAWFAEARAAGREPGAIPGWPLAV